MLHFADTPGRMINAIGRTHGPRTHNAYKGGLPYLPGQICVYS